jgi:hypothetical protein
MSPAREMLGGCLLFIGAVVVLGVISALQNPSVPVGDALLEKYSDKYVLLGQKVVDKEIGGVLSTQMVPALFIYVLRDRSDPHKALVRVSQSHGYSVAHVQVSGSALGTPVAITGEGNYWGDRVSSKFNVPDKAYEKEVALARPKEGVLEVEVTYWWMWRGAGVSSGNFANRSATTSASFDLGTR